MALDQSLIPNILGKASKKAGDLLNIGKTQLSQLTNFARESPILSGAAVGTIVGGGLIVAQQIRKRKKARPKVTRRKTTRRKVTRRRNGRRIIRGPGLGRSEIKHTRKGTKLVSFRTKGGKLVRFKVKGSSTRRRGFVKKRKKR